MVHWMGRCPGPLKYILAIVYRGVNGMAKVVAVETVKCNYREDEEHVAVVIVFEDGEVEVRCSGGCFYSCRYGRCVNR